MSNHHHYNNKKEMDPKVKKHMEKIESRDFLTDHLFRRTLHWIERAVAVVTLVALLTALANEVLLMIQDPTYFSDVTRLLHHLLNIVVGLEFVRMLIDTTPANILEVLTVAITRHVILSHEDPVSNIISVACIAGLFATRRYLIRRHELREEMVEVE